MFNLFKKKYKDISDYPETWSVSKGEYDGDIVSIRFRSLEEAAGHPDYPYQIGVAVGFQKETENGLPGKDDSDELWNIEEGIIKLLETKHKCIFALVLTTDNMREFVFYSPEWNPEKLDLEVTNLDKKFPPYKFNFMMQEDKNWSTFKKFTK